MCTWWQWWAARTTSSWSGVGALVQPSHSRAASVGGVSHWPSLTPFSRSSCIHGRSLPAFAEYADAAPVLRTFSRVDSIGQFPIDVVPVVETAVRLTAHEIRRRAQLVLDLGDTPSVIANEGRLGQVMVNLMTNAAQAIPEGAPETNRIRAATWTDAEGRAQFTDIAMGTLVKASIPGEAQPIESSQLRMYCLSKLSGLSPTL